MELKEWSVVLFVLFLVAAASGIEVSPGFEVEQYGNDAAINFTQSLFFDPLNVYPSSTGFNESNFTVAPSGGEVGLELDNYTSGVDRPGFVTNFSAETGASDVNFSLSDLPDSKFYEALRDGSRVRIDYTDSESFFNFSSSFSSSDFAVRNYGRKGVGVDNISFNSSNPVEGNTLLVNYTLENIGQVETESPNVTLTGETFNGTEWVEKDFFSGTESIGPSENTSAPPGEDFRNFTWSVEPGPWRFNVTADPDDDIPETNESDNDDSALLDVDSYEIFYGGSDSKLLVGSGSREIYRWDPGQDSGNIYVYDRDSSFFYSDLEPVEGSKLLEVDNALNLRGHNDSVQELWDADDDGLADRNATFSVGNRNLEVPVANSTENSPFDTGLLYDSSEGTPFDGSQTLVLVTEILPSTSGTYDTYDYEIRVPFSLRELEGVADEVSIEVELE